MVLPDSHRITRVPWYLGTFKEGKSLIYRTITVFGHTFQSVQLTFSLVTPRYFSRSTEKAPQLHTCNDCNLWHRYGLGLSPFARHYLGNLNWFLFLEVLRCFNSLRVPLTTTLLMMRWLGITPAGLLHSETHGSNACLVANRVLSWPTPSFVVSISRGIHLELKSLKISKFFLYS